MRKEGKRKGLYPCLGTQVLDLCVFDVSERAGAECYTARDANVPTYLDTISSNQI